MSITDLSPLPSQSSRPDTFDEDAEGLFAKLPGWAADVDAARNQAVEAAGAGASGHRFNFDSSTVAADPTSGKLRFNNSNVTAATAAYFSATSSTGAALGALLDTFDDSTSAKKGVLRVVKSSDPSKFAIFYLTGVASAGTYRTFTLVHVQSSSASPFAAGDMLSIQYAQIGDKGDKGEQGVAGSNVHLASFTVSSPVSVINFLSIFNSAYDRYTIEVQGMTLSASDLLCIRLAKNGAADSTANTYYWGSDLSLPHSERVVVSKISGEVHAGTIDVMNTNNVASFKAISIASLTKNQASYVGLNRMAAYVGENIVTGFSLFSNGMATITGGTIRVFGHRNS